MHITLSFLGNVGTHRLPEIEAAAEGVAAEQAPFHLEVRGIGAFPEERAGRVVWAGTQKSRELVALRERVVDRMAALGYPREERDFHPHITLCRLRNIMSLREWVEPFRRQSFGEIEVRELALYRSVPCIPYPDYLPVRSFPFRDEGDIT
jgi:2'-5' RNA ligase